MDDCGDDVFLSVLLGKILRRILEELLLLPQGKCSEEICVRADDKGTHQNGVAPYFPFQRESGDLIVEYFI